MTLFKFGLYSQISSMIQYCPCTTTTTTTILDKLEILLYKDILSLNGCDPAWWFLWQIEVHQ